MEFDKLEIQEIAEVIAGQSPPSDTYNESQIGLPFYQGMADFQEKHPKTRIWCSNPKKISEPNDILMSVRAPVGPVNLANVKACIGRGISAIRVKKGVSSEYLYYYLKSNRRQISSLGVGTTFKAIRQEDVKKIKVDLPSFKDQIKIALILKKIEELIAQRKESLLQLNELVKSTFLKMLGDLRKHDQVSLDELCHKITDGTHDTPKRLKEGVKFITGKHIKPSYIDFKNSDYVTQEVHDEIYRRCNPQYGDILYTNIGANLGTAAMNTVKYEFSMKNVALLKPNYERITSRYLENILNLEYQKNHIVRVSSSGAAQKFLSLKGIGQIRIPLPNLLAQGKFSEFVERIEKIKPKFKESLKELENLYGSLSHRAFKGELDLEKLSIDHIEPRSKGGGDEFENLQVLTQVDNIKKADKTPEQWDKFKEVEKEKEQDFVKIKEVPKKKIKSKLITEGVTVSQIAEWIKEEFDGKYFTSEMLIRFCKDERVTFPYYFTSKELKENRKADLAQDLKEIIFQAINKENEFLKLEQVFYNGEEENFVLEVRPQDYDLIEKKSAKERSGIYLKLKE